MTPDVGHLEGRTVFITGGTGSLGRTLAAAILDHTREARVAVYSRGESRQAEMAEEFSRHRDRLRMRLGTSGIWIGLSWRSGGWTSWCMPPRLSDWTIRRGIPRS